MVVASKLFYPYQKMSISKVSTDSVWIVDDDKSIRWVLDKALSKAGFLTETFSNAGAVIESLQQATPLTLISDIRMPGMDGMTLLKKLQQSHPDIPIIIMTAHSDLESTVSAYEGGAFEYLPKPFDIEEAIQQVKRACETAREKSKKSEEPVHDTGIIGDSVAMQNVFRMIGRLSRSTVNVLINGESGTGKELVAAALHKHSPRANKPFVALNMAAIPSELMESELFGHEKGAFTGAYQQRIGHFEQASGGTLFLDEIGDMPMKMQTRLLRVLSDQTFFRVGGHQPIQSDTRIITATHQNLSDKVADGDFREDLYHRINVIRLQLPPLRERKEDITLLLDYFLTKSAATDSTRKKYISAEALDVLMHYNWPGNVRELENFSDWLSVMAPGNEVRPDDLPDEFLHTHKQQDGYDWQSTLVHTLKQQLIEGNDSALQDVQVEFENLIIEIALNNTNGNKQAAAKLLGMGRNTLGRKLKPHDS